MNEDTISFKPLAKEDLPLLHRWLNKEHVRRFYAMESSLLEQVENKYEKKIKGEEQTYPYLIICENQPIGYIQTYKISDHPEYQRLISIPHNPAGLDLFIGEEQLIGKGFGTSVIKKFVKEIVFTRLDVDSCMAGPSEDNSASIRAFEKAGFQYLKTVHNDKDNTQEYVMLLEKH